ncbi:MAG: ABC transporter substrate-binding protein [Anaerofustis sp.]
MKKKLLVVFLVALMVVSIASCGKSTGDMLINDGVLTVGIEPEYPPMEYKNDSGSLVGFDVDMANEIADRMGVKVQFVETAWDGIFMGLDAQKYDVVISSVSITQDRIDAGEFLLTDPYMNNGQYIVVRKDGNEIATTDQLAGLKVGVQFATTADEACAKQQETVNFSVTQYDTVQQAFLALQAGYVDAVVVDSMVAIDYVNNNPDTYKITSAKLTNEPLGIAVGKDNQALVDKLNKVIAEMHKDGTLTKLSEKYLGGYDATTDIDTELK